MARGTKSYCTIETGMLLCMTKTHWSVSSNNMPQATMHQQRVSVLTAVSRWGRRNMLPRSPSVTEIINKHHGVRNHRRLGSWFHNFFMLWTKKHQRLKLLALCDGNTGFPLQMACNAGSLFRSWHTVFCTRPRSRGGQFRLMTAANLV